MKKTLTLSLVTLFLNLHAQNPVFDGIRISTKYNVISSYDIGPNTDFAAVGYDVQAFFGGFFVFGVEGVNGTTEVRPWTTDFESTYLQGNVGVYLDVNDIASKIPDWWQLRVVPTIGLGRTEATIEDPDFWSTHNSISARASYNDYQLALHNNFLEGPLKISLGLHLGYKTSTSSGVWSDISGINANPGLLEFNATYSAVSLGLIWAPNSN